LLWLGVSPPYSEKGVLPHFPSFVGFVPNH